MSGLGLINLVIRIFIVMSTSGPGQNATLCVKLVPCTFSSGQERGRFSFFFEFNTIYPIQPS